MPSLNIFYGHDEATAEEIVSVLLVTSETHTLTVARYHGEYYRVKPHSRKLEMVDLQRDILSQVET